MSDHEADGIYYLTRTILENKRACPSQCGRFSTVFGQGRVPVTLDNVTRAMFWCFDFSWLLDRMTRNEHITQKERLLFFTALVSAEATRESAAKAFMDLLAKRARREGRLSP